MATIEHIILSKENILSITLLLVEFAHELLSH